MCASVIFKTLFFKFKNKNSVFILKEILQVMNSTGIEPGAMNEI